MFSTRMILTSSLFVLAAACTVGDESQVITSTGSGDVAYLDTNHDGTLDAIDVDGDGIADYAFDLSSCDDCSNLHPVAFCAHPLIDTNGDGSADGLDWNCDGVIDVWLSAPSGGGGGGGGQNVQQCKQTSALNQVQYSIDCKTTNGSSTCNCSLDGQVTNTCTTSSSDPCDIGGNNCCGF